MFTVVNNERKLLPVPLKTWKRVRALKITTQNNNENVIERVNRVQQKVACHERHASNSSLKGN